MNGTGYLDISNLTTSGTTAGSIEGAGNVFLGSKNLAVGGNNFTTTFSGVIQDGGPLGGTGGSLTKTGSGTLTLSGVNTYTGGTTVMGGLINFNSTNSFGSGAITLNGGGLQWASGTSTDISSQLAAFGVGGATFDTNSNNLTLASVLSGAGSLTKTGAGMLTLTGVNSYTGGTTISGGTLQLGNGGTSGSIIGNVTDNSIFAINHSDAVTYGGVISGTGAFQQNGTGTTTLTGTNTYSGGTTVSAGILQLGNGGTSGSIIGNVTDNSIFAINRSDAFTFGGVISGTGAFQQNGTGTTILSGTNTYTGATTINAGTLEVDGSIANTSGVTVKSGGTLTGSGTVETPAATTINSGGTLAPGTPGVPGTFMTITGNLAFQPGAIYVVSLNPSTSTYAVVTGTASLAGTVNAAFAPGSYVVKQYDILRSAGLGGTMFATNLSNFSTSLSYTSTDVLLNLTAATLGVGTSLNGNQQSVANAINGFFNGGGTLPPGFGTLFGLTGGNLANALSQVSGEAATGAQQDAFQLMSEFLGLMLDPYADGRGSMGGSANAFAAEQPASFPAEVANAYAAVLKAPASQAPNFERRWSAWASGFGGYNTTNGDAAAGTHDLTAQSLWWRCRRRLPRHAGHNSRLCASRRRHQLEPGAGARWRPQRRLSGWPIRQDPLRGRLCERRVRLCQSLDVDRPLCVRRRPSHCRLQRL